MWQKCRHCDDGIVTRRKGKKDEYTEDCMACKGEGGREVPDDTPLNPKRKDRDKEEDNE